jgi:hypothetical protein
MSEPNDDAIRRLLEELHVDITTRRGNGGERPPSGRVAQTRLAPLAQA